MTVIYNLQDAVDRYIARGTAPATEDSTAIVHACQQLLGDLARLQREYQSLRSIQFSINQCQHLLVSVLDKAYTAGIAPDLFATLRHTLMTFDDIYGHYIHLHNRLSLVEQEELYRSSRDQLIQLCPHLIAKHIPASYLAELEYALKTLFKSGKPPHLHYYHRGYLQTLMLSLADIAYDKRNKDWAKRFVIVMIRYDFNYPGFFNRWVEQLSHYLAQMDSPLQQYQSLCEIEDMLRRSIYIHELQFDIDRRPLLAAMRKHIKKAVENANLALDKPAPDATNSLITTLNGKELSLLFNYFYKLKTFDYPNKREAAKVFSESITSISGRHITYKTLEKFEKYNLESSAIKVRRLLKAIIDAIDQDFNR